MKPSWLILTLGALICASCTKSAATLASSSGNFASGVPLRDVAASATEQKSSASDDHSLVGYDLTLSFDEFQTKYKSDLRDCTSSPQKYSDSDPEEIPFQSCKFKDGGTVTFLEYQGKWTLVEFSKKVFLTKITLSQAAEELRKKAGAAKYQVEDGQTYGVCRASVPFLGGIAEVISGGSLNPSAAMQGCTKFHWEKATFEEASYSNTVVGKALREAKGKEQKQRDANQKSEQEKKLKGL